MKTFLGMEVEQKGGGIKLHLDYYIQQVLKEYKEYIKKMLHPKKVPISPCVALKLEDVQGFSDLHKQMYYWLFVVKLPFAAIWFRMDISLTVSHLA